MFLLIVFIIDKAAVLLIGLKRKFDVDFRLEMLLEGKLNKDILVLGPSTASRDILAGMIEDSLGASTINLSDYSADIIYTNFIFQTYLKTNRTPKIVCLSLTSSIELQNETGFSPLIYREDKLVPFLDYKVVNEEFIRRNKHSFVSRFMFSARMRLSHLTFNYKTQNSLDTILPCGSKPIFLPHIKKDIKFIDTIMDYNPEFDDQKKLNAFRDLINTCDKNNIELLLLIPPMYRTFDVKAYNHMKQFESDYCHLLSYDTLNSLYKDTALYYDWAHLNIEGAKIYTQEIIKEITNLNFNN